MASLRCCHIMPCAQQRTGSYSHPTGWLRAVIAATSTHSDTTAAPIWRVVIPFTRNVTPGETSLIFAALQARIGNAADDCGATISQAYFLPSVPAAHQHEAFFVHHTAPWLDPDEILAEPAGRADGEENQRASLPAVIRDGRAANAPCCNTLGGCVRAVPHSNRSSTPAATITARTSFRRCRKPVCWTGPGVTKTVVIMMGRQARRVFNAMNRSNLGSMS